MSGFLGNTQFNGPSICEQFFYVAKEHWDRVAITDADGGCVTYATLAARAAAIALRLREAGVGRGDRVAVLYGRNSRFVEAILGVLAVGAAYVPLDVSHPAGRIGYILGSCGAKLLLSEAGAPRPESGIARVETNELPGGAEFAPVGADPARPIYVIYTSGTTGRPKGVEVCEGNLAALFDATSEIYNFSPHHVWTLFHSTSFDFSVWEIYGAILYGGRIVCVDPCTALDPARFAKLIVTEGVTFLNQTPSAFYRLLDHIAERPPLNWESNKLEWVVFGGEALSFPRLRPWLGGAGARAKLVNMYGITETCVHTSWHVLSDADIRGGGESNIGKPLRGAEFHLLDADGKRVARGEPGENWVTGPQVSLGYLGQPDLTAQRFMPPLALGSHERAYRTGDLLRERADGSYDYLGRCDDQVNIRGFRVELQEVEAALTGLPDVLDACVATEGQDDMTSLVGFIATDGSRRTPGEWRGLIRDTGRLPDYMIPNRIVCVDSVPLTVNGKKDRKKLLELYGAHSETDPAALEPAGDDMVSHIRRLWSFVLGHEAFGNSDNFFDVGGTSLRAVQLFTLLIRNGLADPDLHTVVTLFEHPTVSKLAAELAEKKDSRQRVAAPSTTRAKLNGDPSDEVSGIAIVGLSGRFPGAKNAKQFWDNLLAGRAPLTRFSRAELEDAFDEATRDSPDYVAARPIIDDVELFDAGYFGMSPREAALTDPQQRLFLEICVEALEDAGFDPQRYEGAIGVFAGSSMNTYFIRHVCPDRAAIDRFTSDFQVGSYSELLGTLQDFVATRVSYKLDLRGPAISQQSGCSTSLLAVAQACQSLRTKQCDMALAGGVSITFPQKRGYLYQEGGMASPDGSCRPFDVRSAGTVFGSGAGVVLLKRLADAITDGDTIYAVIKGYGVNNDGSGKAGFTAPSVSGQANCIKAAMTMAGFAPESVGYIECHGTATPLGDPIEIEGLTQAFSGLTNANLAERSEPCVLGSVKANVGHLDAAAGITGLIKTALILDRGLFPPQINFDEPNPRLDLKRGGFTVLPWGGRWNGGGAPRRAGVSAFGVGGTNVHLSLEEAPPRAMAAEDEAREPLIIRLSARSKESLAAMPARLADVLETGAAAGRLSLADAAYTLRNGRRELEYRAAIAANSVSDAVGQLRGLKPKGRSAAAAPRAVFMFPGQGAQYPGMGRALYDADPAFRADVDAAAEVIESHLGQDIRRVLFDDQELGHDTPHPIRSTTLAQPALFLIEYALARRLMRFGVEPVALIGHSLGELVAAVLAGVMSYEDALQLVVNRGRIMQAQPAGAMLSVRMAAAELRSLLPAGVEIGSENAPLLSVASGPFDAIAALEARLVAEGIGHRRLHTSHAFHSAMMDPAVEKLEHIASALRLNPPRVRLMSTVTGRWMTDAEATSPHYWARQCREMVAFRTALDTLLREAEAGAILIEAGPGVALSTFSEAAEARGKAHAIIPTAPDFADRAEEARIFAEALGQLWCAGFTIKDDGALAGARRVHLPTYPFQRERHWIERPAAASAPASLSVSISAPTASMSAPTAQPVSDNQQAPAKRDLGEAAVAAAVLASLKAILSEISGRTLSEADHASSFLSLGFDSLLLGQVAQRVNKTFGVKITFRQLMRDLNTLETLAAMVKTSAPADKLPKTASSKPALLPGAPAAPAMPVPATPPVAMPADAAPAGSALQAVVREQLQAMERLFAAQIAAAGGASEVAGAQPMAAPASAPLPSDPASDILMPETGVEASSRFRVYKPAGATDDMAMEPRHRRYLDDLIRRYNAKTAGSKACAQASRRSLADPRTASGFNGSWKEIVYPLVSARSKGASIWDIDGNEYTDLVNGYGQTMFGHAPDFVAEAVRTQLDQGFAIGPQTPLAGEVAARVSALTGNERVAFCNTGSEAVMAALRVARAVTGRDKVVMFEGAYHGQFDEVLIKARRAGLPVGAQPIAPGIPGVNVGSMIVLPNNHPQSLDIVRRLAGDLAAVIVEPVQSRHPDVRPREFLAELRAITEKSGTALVFDEVVTGFRVHPGGMQHLFNIRADLATYGKVLGGGMPIGVVAGSARFMDALDGGFWQYGDDSEPEVAPTFFAGTFVRHPLVMAAARAVLDHIEANADAIYAPLGTRTENLAARINGDLARRGLPTKAEHFTSWFCLDVSHYGPLASLLYAELRLAGIHVHEGFPCFLTTAHTAENFQAIGDAFERAFDAMAEASIISAPSAVFSPAAMPPRATTAPLTEPQMEIFLAAQMGDAASMAFNESLTVRFEGPFDARAMEGAVKAAVRRHDALRCHIGEQGDTLEILPDLAIDIPSLDFSGSDAEDRLAALQVEEARTPFDLFRGPLVRASLIKLAPQTHALVLTVHHIVCDGWSMNTLLEEVAALYNAARTGRDAALAQAPSFAAYARDQHREPNADVAAFWKEMFATLPEPAELPLDRPRPLVKTFAGASLRESLGEALFADVKALARREGVSLFNVLFAAVQAVFGRLSRNETLVLTVPMGGQALLDDQNLVGHCVNFLPVPAPMPFERPFVAHVKAVEDRVNAVLDHQEYTLGSLVRDLNVPRSPGRTPLSDIQFNLERVGSHLAFDGVASEIRTNAKAFVNYDLFLNMIEGGSDIAIEIDYATDLFDEATISRWIGHLRSVLKAAAAAPATAIAELPLTGGSELRQAIEPETVYRPRDEDLLPRLFERWCDKTPDAAAVEFGGKTLSYREVDARANRIATCLADLAPTPGARIAVAVERSLDLPVVLLAVAKAGHAYVPVDPALPPARVRQMVEAAKVAVFVTSGDLPAAAASGLSVLDLNRDAKRIAAAPSVRPSRLRADNDPSAYVIFTSGSTGVPKGVEVGHLALANFLGSMAKRPGFTSADIIVAVTTVSFDIAALELLLPFCCGGRTVIAGRDTLIDPPELVRLIASSGATVLQATPTLWRVLLEAGFRPKPGFKALCGGEPMPRDLARDLIAMGVELWNMYGPTETTIWSACGRVTDTDQPIAIGAPIDRTGLYVLEDSGALAPAGVPGELYISGAGLAKGYIGQPDLTRQAFPLVSLEGAAPQRFYRTGDLAVRHPDGAIQVLGRRDQQVKVRGFRIELEEIEAVLRSCPGIRDAAVAVEQAGTPDAALTAGLIPAAGVTVTARALQETVGAKLPAYMMPGRFVSMTEFPRTANGKLDRRALLNTIAEHPSLEKIPAEPVAVQAPEPAPRDATLEKVTAVIEGVLGRKGIQPKDRIFALGATSLHVFRMAARFGEARLPLKAQHLMSNPSIDELARRAAAPITSQPQKKGPSLSDFKRRTSA